MTEDIKEGVVWTIPHFAVASADRLANDALDKRAKIPDYKTATAEVEVGIEPVDEPEPAED